METHGSYAAEKQTVGPLAVDAREEEMVTPRQLQHLQAKHNLVHLHLMHMHSMYSWLTSLSTTQEFNLLRNSNSNKVTLPVSVQELYSVHQILQVCLLFVLSTEILMVFFLRVTSGGIVYRAITTTSPHYIYCNSYSVWRVTSFQVSGFRIKQLLCLHARYILLDLENVLQKFSAACGVSLALHRNYTQTYAVSPWKQEGTVGTEKQLYI